MNAEEFVLETISAHIPYAIIHNAPAGNRQDIENIFSDNANQRIVKVNNITASPFDWISAFEKADLLAMEDSLHANVVEQLNIQVKKYLFLRSSCEVTPVFKNGWIFK